MENEFKISCEPCKIETEKLNEIIDEARIALINNWQHHIDEEQNSSAKKSFQCLLNDFISEEKANKELLKYVKQLEDDLQKNKINSILKENYENLKEKYNQVQEELDEIKTTLYKLLRR